MDKTLVNIVAEPEGSYQHKVVLSPLVHREERQIGIVFPKDNVLIKAAKQINGVLWSNTHKCWYVQNKPENLKRIFAVFRGLAWVDSKALFEKKNDFITASAEKTKPQKKILLTKPLSQENSEKIDKFVLWMKSKRYAANTQETYKDSLKTFFRFYHNKKAEEINREDLIRFNNEYILSNNYSPSFQNQIVNALKLFFNIIETKNIDIKEIERPKRTRKLPKVIAKEDIEKMLTSIGNFKHQTALTIVYACGLRRRELIMLQLRDIDWKRKSLLVRNSKGNKDRILPLSDKLLQLIERYIKSFNPEKYLIEGQRKGDVYSETSFEKIFQKYLPEYLRNRNFTPHCLRHSYATHLLEAGVDLRYIQELLGHKSSKTTEIYTWVSMKNLQNIKNPIDDFDL